MEDFRSRSRGEGLEVYYGSRAVTGGGAAAAQTEVKEPKVKKGKGGGGSGAWSFNDPELQRKKRVAGYKVYTVEGKMKGSLRKSFRWIKDRCSLVVYGWR